LTAEHLSKMYDFDYFSCENESDLQSEMQLFLTSGKPSIIEVFTPTEVNNKVLLEYFKNLT